MHFSAIGVLAGNITQEDDKLFISIQNKEYPLFYSHRYKRRWQLLKQFIKNNSTTRQKIVVYPKILHFYNPNEIHNISFHLVKFKPQASNTSPEEIPQTLQFNEFKIFGLWQLIKQCQTPVISVYRNLDQKHLQQLEKLDPQERVKHARYSHVPVIWEKPPVKPIKLYSKKHPYFVQIKAKFNPTTDIFEFDTLLSPPTKECPEYFKPIHKKPKSKEESKSNNEEYSASTAG